MHKSSAPQSTQPSSRPAPAPPAIVGPRLPTPEQPAPHPRTVVDQESAVGKVAAPAGGSADRPVSPPSPAQTSTPPQRPDPTHSSSTTAAVGRTVPNRTTYELLVDGAATGQGFVLRVDAEAALEKTRGLYPGRRIEVREVIGADDT